ncbi:MAG: glycosyltransferase [Candidatus Lokiarchaeota archaeon]|nr:glycosyltransferase [Candidatus Lokiarchaeota archaeon]
MSKIKILMIPDYRRVNPYQKLLSDSIFQSDINVLFPKKRYIFFPLLRNLMKYNFNILHLHWIHEFAGFRFRFSLITLLKSISFLIDLVITRLIFRYKIVWTIHNIVSHDLKHPFLEKTIRKIFFKFTDSIIVHCRKAKEILNYIYQLEKKIWVIPHGNYIDSYKNDISKMKARKRLKLDMNDFVYLFFGRIKPYKGVISLIREFKSLKFDRRNKLLIIGKPNSNEIKSNILNEIGNSDNIFYNFNYIKNEDVQIFMNSSDIVVLPYKKILTSGEVILALSFGKTIITPKLGCIPDLLDENSAFLYNPKNKNALRNIISKVNKNREKIVEMENYNKELVKKYDWEKIANKYVVLYKSLNYEHILH